MAHYTDLNLRDRDRTLAYTDFHKTYTWLSINDRSHANLDIFYSPPPPIVTLFMRLEISSHFPLSPSLKTVTSFMNDPLQKMTIDFEINRTAGVLGNIGGTIFLGCGWSFTGSMGGLRNSPSVRFKELDLLFWGNWFFLRKQTWIFTKDFFAEGDISYYVHFDKWSHLPRSSVHFINMYPGVNFINSIRAHFSYEISQQSQNVTRKTTFVRKICTYTVDEIDTSCLTLVATLTISHMYKFVLYECKSLLMSCSVSIYKRSPLSINTC